MILFLGYIIKIYIYCSECIDLNKYFAQESCNESESSYQEPSLSLFDSPISENEQKECLGFFDAPNMSMTNDIPKIIHHNEEAFITNDDLSDYLRFLDNITWESSDEEKFSNINNMRPEKFKEYLKQTYDNINYYINSNLPKNNASNYIKRLDKIIETINIVNPSEITYDEIFTIEIDNYLKYILDDLKLKYMNNELNDENFDLFSVDLDLKLQETQKFKNFNNIHGSIKKVKNPHLREFIRMYKYAKVFPELLSLGCASTEAYLKKVTIYFHMLALFCEANETNLIDLRVIVMFLIKKSFLYSNKHKLDIFILLKFQEADSAGRVDLNFFIWEFSNKIRHRIRQRIIRSNNQAAYIYDDEKVNFKIVLRLLLIQHLIYLKMINVKFSKFEDFKNFMDDVLICDNRPYSDYFCQFLDMI